MAHVPVNPANLARLAAGALALAYGLGAVAVARGPGELTTYAGRSDLAAALAVAAGLALVAAGLVVSLARPAGPVGDLALLAGVVWFAPFWAGWKGGPPLVLSLGTLAAGFVFPLLLHLVLAYPSGRLRSRGERALVGAVYLEAALSVLGRALFRDPFFDPNCWDNCTDNVFLVRSLPRVARGIEEADLWFTAAAALVFAALCVWRLASATAPARRIVWPVLAGGLGLAAATIAHSAALVRTPLEDPGDPTFLAIFAAGCAAVIVIGLGLPWGLLRARVQRRSVARIVAELGEAPPPGSLESALAKAIGDPELRIAYWLPATGRYVDGGGHPVEEPVAASGRAVTPLVRGGRRVALVTHAAAVTELEHEMGAAVRLALENERLQAEVLAQLQDLRVSRARRRDGRCRAAPARARPPRRRPAAAPRSLLRSAPRRVGGRGRRRRRDGFAPRGGDRRCAGRPRRAPRSRARHPPGDPDRGRARSRARVTRRDGIACGRDRRDDRRALPGIGRDGGLSGRRRGDRGRGDKRRNLRGRQRDPSRRPARGRGGGRRLAAHLHAGPPGRSRRRGRRHPSGRADNPTSGDPMRVVVADDVMLTRQGIVRLLREAEIDVVAEAEDAEALLRHVRLARPDAAIVDIRMPPTHTDEGLVAAQTIRAEHPSVGVLVLSQYVEPSYALRLIEEHPERVGYLLKERVFDVAVLVDALRRIDDGETVVDPTIVSASSAVTAGRTHSPI